MEIPIIIEYFQRLFLFNYLDTCRVILKQISQYGNGELTQKALQPLKLMLNILENYYATKKHKIH